MKERIQEALRRRHRKGDEGFTLIELLVVILIIAILAAVGIVALLSALNSGKKSAAKTTLRNAITSVKSAQTGNGQTNYDGIDAAAMTTEDPDLTWQAAEIVDTDNKTNLVFLAPGTNIITLSTRSDSGICYYALLDSNGPSGYSSADVGTAACATPPVAAVDTTADGSGAGAWKKSTGLGWDD